MSKVLQTRFAIFAFFFIFFLYITSRTAQNSNTGLTNIQIIVILISYFLSVFTMKKFIVSNKSIFICCFFIVIGCIFSYYYNKNTTIYPLISFLCPILIAPNCKLLHVDHVISHALFIIAILYTILTYNIYGGTVNSTGGINGNNLGLIVITSSICILLLVTANSFWKTIYCNGLSLLTISILILSESRTSLFTFFIFLIGKYLPSHLFKKSLLKISFLLLTFGSFIYMYTYILMFLSNFNLSEYLSFFNSSKSAFSGRQYIWLEGFEILKQNLMGVGYNYTLFSHKTNELHNFVLTIYIYYGIITASSMLILLNNVIFKLLSKINDVYIKNCVLAFGCFLFNNLTENSLLSAPICFFPLFLAYNRYNELNESSFIKR